MFKFKSRIFHDTMIICLADSIPNEYTIASFKDPQYYDGKEVAITTLDFAEFEPDVTEEELDDVFHDDPVTPDGYTSFMHRLAMEYIDALIRNLLCEIVDGQMYDGRDIRDIFETPDAAWDPIREVWEHAAREVKSNLLKMLER